MTPERSSDSCAAASGGTCPVSDLTISRIERGLHDMTGTLGGESCGAKMPIGDAAGATDKPAAGGDANIDGTGTDESAAMGQITDNPGK